MNVSNEVGRGFLFKSFLGETMLKKISGRFNEWAKGWLVFVLLLLDFFFMGFIMPLISGLLKDGTGAQQPMDLRFFSTPEKLYLLAGSYGEYGRAFYRSVELSVDIIYPIVYTLAFGLLISWLFQRGFKSDSKMQNLNIVPVGAWLFDLLENLGIVTLLSIFPGQSIAVAWLTIIFTMIKWIFAGASMLLIVIGLVMAAKNRFKKQV
jgi:hypothetical protein